MKTLSSLRRSLVCVASLTMLIVLAAQADMIETNAPEKMSISTFVGNSRIMKIDNPVSRVAVGDPNIADFRIVSPSELLILGRSVGTTNIILWHKNGKSTVIDTSISVDLSSLTKLLEIEFPQEVDVHLHSSAGSIVLSGSVANAGVVNTMVALAEAHARNLNGYLTATTKTSSAIQVINLLKIRDERQMMFDAAHKLDNGNKPKPVEEIRGTEQRVNNIQKSVDAP